jgi:hypothetical protein
MVPAACITAANAASQVDDPHLAKNGTRGYRFAGNHPSAEVSGSVELVRSVSWLFHPSNC